eukprot:m.68551 g.68551  ORF g.68551 m.68551 type:complete len:583 (+) comp9929_c0_seq1:49-1797(+)
MLKQGMRLRAFRAALVTQTTPSVLIQARRASTEPRYEDTRDASRTPPSIFNDVLGPVMRGPSSSHGAAALRIGRICRDLMGGDVKKAIVEYDPNGSLVTTHAGHGSDMGLFGGFLGWDASDERLRDYAEEAKKAGVEMEVKYVSYGAEHPNTYKMTLFNEAGESREVTALSTGGGMIEVVKIDGCDVMMAGDFHETIASVGSEAAASELEGWLEKQEDIPPIEGTVISTGSEGKTLLQVKTRTGLSDATIETMAKHADGIRRVAPVMPVLGSATINAPYLTAASMLEYNRDKNWPFWKLAAHYEAERGGITEEEVVEKMKDLVRIMRAAVETGRKGTEYADRILPCQTLSFEKEMNSGGLVPGDVINKIILYVSAIMEVKSSMGLIVAAPTAGAAGALPGAVLAVADELKKSDEEVAQAMLVAGYVGVLIAEHATFAAEVAGCMAECGSGAGMAAAAITTLGGGTVDQALGASSLALQTSFGMTCDPIANRVEAPCLGKNTMAATNALSCSNMALANFKHLVPLDQVLDAFYAVGISLPEEIRCTGRGGLSVTPAAVEIEKSLGDARYDWESELGSGKKIAC